MAPPCKPLLSLKVDNESLLNFKDAPSTIKAVELLLLNMVVPLISTSTPDKATSLIFLRNRAIQYGGAIYAELSTPFDYLLSHICFIRYYLENVPPDEWKTNFTFVNNTAGESNNTIFASTLRPCSKVYTPRNNLLYEDPFHHHSHITNSVISTLPATFKFLNQGSRIFDVVPGEIFNLPVKLIDELGQDFSSAVFIATCSGLPTPYVVPPYQFTNGSIKIAGKPNDICQLQLETDTEYIRYQLKYKLFY